jgi:hypothetical protein
MIIYKCEYCEKTFDRKPNLIRHYNRKYKCYDETIIKVLKLKDENGKIIQELENYIDKEETENDVELETQNETQLETQLEPQSNTQTQIITQYDTQTQKETQLEPQTDVFLETNIDKNETINELKNEIIETKNELKNEIIETKNEPKIKQIEVKNEPKIKQIEVKNEPKIEPKKVESQEPKIKQIEVKNEHISVAKQKELYKTIKEHITNNQIKDEYHNRNINIPLELLNEYDDVLKPIVKVLLKKCIIEKLDENTFQTLLYNYLTQDIYKIKIHNEHHTLTEDEFFYNEVKEDNIISVAEQNNTNKKNKSEKSYKCSGTKTNHNRSRVNKTLKNTHILVKKLTN